MGTGRMILASTSFEPSSAAACHALLIGSAYYATLAMSIYRYLS